ncbi:hypothetical protein CE195_13345, partial [Sodalis-like symbiont of Philaenus spumarius]
MALNYNPGEKANLDHWPDALFECVYSWAHNGLIKQHTAEAAVKAAGASALAPLADKMLALAIGNITPEWLVNNGYQSAKSPEAAREKREAVVLQYISRGELLSVLVNVERINRLINPTIPTARFHPDSMPRG